jgi:mRNA interferase MazF
MCNGQIRIGEIYMMEFTGTGCEQTGWRPGVVFQNNIGNTFSPNIIVLPLTTAIKKCSQPTHVLISSKDSGIRKDSIVLCENPQRMSKSRIGNYNSGGRENPRFQP